MKDSVFLLGQKVNGVWTFMGCFIGIEANLVKIPVFCYTLQLFSK